MKTIKIIPVLMGLCVAFGAANSFGAQNAGLMPGGAAGSVAGTQKMGDSTNSDDEVVVQKFNVDSASLKNFGTIDKKTKLVNLVNLKITDGKCKMGNCNACKTAEEKCKCIATTYFQYGPMSHQGKHNYGEYTVVRDIYYTGGTCSLGFNYVHGVAPINSLISYTSLAGKDAPDIDKVRASELYGKGTSDKMIQVAIPLKANSTVEVPKCAASAYPRDNNRGSADALIIDKKIAVKFHNCAPYPSGLTYAIGAKQPERGKAAGACYWCTLEGLQNHQDGVSATVRKLGSGTENKKGGFVEL